MNVTFSCPMNEGLVHSLMSIHGACSRINDNDHASMNVELI